MNNLPYRFAQKHHLNAMPKESILNKNMAQAHKTQYMDSFGAATHSHATPVVTTNKFLSSQNQ